MLMVTVKCGYPLKALGDPGNSLVIGYSEPALVGSIVTITISCRIGDEETGNGAAVVLTCMSDGRWSPDPQLIDSIVVICDDSLHHYPELVG